MSRLLFSGLEVLYLLSSSSAQTPQTPGIDHQPVACAAADKFPRLDARFEPADGVASARVVFQGQNTEWYSVEMKREGVSFVGVLPKPKKSLKSFRYYIEVTDRAVATSRTPDYTTAVVESSSACKGKITAVALASASVLIQGPAGALALPAGFASAGVVAAGSAAGASAGAAGATAGAGGGIGATALVVGGLAVAGGAVAVGVAKKGGDSTSASPATTSAPPGSVYTVFFSPPPGIDVSICAGGSQQVWNAQNVQTDASGSFNETWAPTAPNLVRVTGQATAATFQAAVSCVNGAQSGSISATGSTSSYSGTFSFGSSRGQVTVTKQN